MEAFHDTGPSVAFPGSPIRAAVECVLFVAGDPVSPRRAAAALGIEEVLAIEVLEDLRLNPPTGGGLQVVRVAGGYQLCTRPEHAEVVSRFLQPAAQRLSRQAMETLAIIAYRQPMTQPEIDAIRGVHSGGVLKTLLDRALIREAGRKETVGRPILYATTDTFLKQFGLNDLSELPSLEDSIAQDGRK
jgi:segregation and condensation protein B